MRSPSVIDLSQLPPPKVIEALDYESVLAERKASWLSLYNVMRVARPNLALPEINSLELETEPVVVCLQENAYREMTLRALINDKVRALLLAFSTGSDLTHLGALLGVERLKEEDGSEESDERYLRRVQLAPEAFSVAGPPGAYEYHALTCNLSIYDAHVWFPDLGSGKVDVVLAGAGGEPVTDDVLWKVIELFRLEDVVPGTDIVNVRRASRLDYSISGTLYVPNGPDPALLKASAEAALRKYAGEKYRIARTAFRTGFVAAAKVGGVENFILTSPPADVVANHVQIPFLSAVNLNVVVI